MIGVQLPSAKHVEVVVMSSVPQVYLITAPSKSPSNFTLAQGVAVGAQDPPGLDSHSILSDPQLKVSKAPLVFLPNTKTFVAHGTIGASFLHPKFIC